MIVYTGGTFDLFHYGHLNLLKKCKSLGDMVIVGLNSDAFVEKYKGSKPVMSYKERKAMLYGCKYVDLVVENTGNEDSSYTILTLENKGLKPDLVVIGSDWHDRDYLGQMNFSWDWLGKHDIGLCYVKYTKGISTTDLKGRLAKS